MKEQCFNEGTIQAFLDGELASDLLENVARHVALCDDCALLLQEAEAESAFAFSALDVEFNSLVPTERIRTSVYQAISEIEKPRISIWEKVFGLGFIFSNPSLSAFASLLIVAGMFAIVWNFRNQNAVLPSEIANNVKPSAIKTESKPAAIISAVENSSPSPQFVSAADDNVEKSENRPAVAKFQRAIYRPEARNLKYTAENRQPLAAPVEAELLSGEDTYIKTIATLKKTVDGNKDEILRPSARVAFEKDLAMVNDAIAKMKTEVRKNPKNEAAKEILRNSYQHKIDLLSSVAERNELMATLK